MDLHALLNDCKILATQHEFEIQVKEKIPSNGFIRASLAIVAAAPLVAGQDISKN
jgi:hypothetical protein